MYDISKLDRWIGRETDVRQVGVWRDLLHDFGDALPFLIDEKFVEQIPEVGRLKQFKKDAKKFPNRMFKTYSGATWVLMAHLDKYAKLPNPFSKLGFLFPLEWKKVEKDEVGHHGEFLPPELLKLADMVKQQLAGDGIAVDDFYLYPWRGFRGMVDFRKMDASFDSAWGALVSGLYLASHPKVLFREWPFSSVAFDFDRGTPVAVGELSKKIVLAASFNAEEIAVAPAQCVEARHLLKSLKSSPSRYGCLRKMRVFPWRWSGDLVKSVGELVRCNQHNARKRLVRTLLINALSLLLLSVAGVWYWFDWNREKIAYFVDYVDCYGVPQGIVELTQDQIVGRGQAYRFHYQGYDSIWLWKRKPILRSAYCVNSFDHVRAEGNEMPLHAPAAGRRFYYSEDCQTLTRVVHLEIDGTVKAIYNYAGRDADIVDVVRRGADGRLGTALEAVTLGKAVKLDRIGRYRIGRDRNGYAVKIESFRRGSNIPVPDQHGVYCKIYQLDAWGRVISETFTEWDGISVSMRTGVERREFAYDDDGNVAEVRQVRNGKVCFIENREYDNHGNLLVSKTQSLDSTMSAKGCPCMKMTYDSCGEMVSKELFEADGSPYDCSFFQTIRRVEFVGGRIVSSDESYFDAKGHEGAFFGCTREVCCYDENMRKIEVRKYDKNGQLYNLVRHAYDSIGREIEVSVLGSDGTPILDPQNGFALKQIEYAEHECGQLVKTIRYFDTKHKPCRATDVGGSVDEMTFDRHGRIIQVRELDEAGDPLVCNYGWHKTTFRHDRLGYLSEIAYWGSDGHAVLADGFGNYGKVGRIVFINDEAGRTRETQIYNENGLLMGCSDGYAILRHQYDVKGRVVETALFGADEKPIEPHGGTNWRTVYFYNDEGYKTKDWCFSLDGSYVERMFDQMGNAYVESHFATNGEPVVDENGVHAYVFERDKTGHEVKRSFLDIAGRSVLNVSGIAGVLTVYDAHGSICEETRFGVNGELVNNDENVCIVRWHFNEKHQNVGKSFYDKHTNLVENTSGIAGIRKAYDAAGNKNEEYNINSKGMPIPDDYGVSIWHDDFDAKGHNIKRSFYNAMREPVLNVEGIAGWQAEYDAVGNVTTRKFFGLDGLPCMTKRGHAGWMKEYDAHGNVIKFMRVGLDGLPILDSEGTAGLVKQYDGRNRCAVEKYLGADGKSICTRRMFDAHLMCTVDVERVEFSYEANGMKTLCWVLARGYKGIDRIVQVHDDLEDLIEVRFENVSRKLVALPSGFAKVKNKYNTFHELTMREWYDALGRRCDKQGVYKFVIEYDRTGNGLRQTIHNYDKNGFSVADETGAAFAERRYDGAYRFLSGKMLDAKGNPIVMKGLGCAEIALTRDGEGRVTRAEAFDEKGRGAFDGFAGLEMSYSTAEDGSLLVSVTRFDSDGVKQETLADVPYSSKALAWLRNLAGIRYQRPK